MMHDRQVVDQYWVFLHGRKRGWNPLPIDYTLTEAWPAVWEEPSVSVDVGCRISAILSRKRDPIRSVKGYRNSEQSSAARESLWSLLYQ